MPHLQSSCQTNHRLLCNTYSLGGFLLGFFFLVMIKLFKYEGYTVTVEPEALMLAPFKALWKRDKSRDKNRAMQELAYIYFMGDPRSDYQYLVDEEVRSQEIKKGEGLPDDWQPDEAVKRALAFYNSFKPASAGLLEDTRHAVNKLRELLRNINLEERDDKGKPVYTLNTITATIKQIPSLVKDLDEAERTLAKDIIQDSKARGSQSKALYEDDV